MKFLIPDAKSWSRVLAKWITELKAGDIILLEGPMAAGKTTFVRAALETFGIYDVASPTYALHHQYKTEKFEINHWDLYRLKNLDELETTSFWDILNEPKSISLIEWPGLIPEDQWPKDRRQFLMEFQVVGDSREVTITQRA